MPPSDSDRSKDPAKNAPAKKLTFEEAMWRIRYTKPIAADRSAAVADGLFPKYQRLFAYAGIPLEQRDLERYSELLQTHGPGSLAHNPELYAKDSIGVAALADMHRAPGARRIADMDRDTLESEMSERTMACEREHIAPSLVIVQNEAVSPPPPTLLRVSRNDGPEESKNADFAQVGKILSVDAAYVTQQTADGTFRYRTADIAAAADLAQIRAARDGGEPVKIERRDGRVSAGVAKQQLIDRPVATAVKKESANLEARVRMTNWPGKRPTYPAVEMHGGRPNVIASATKPRGVETTDVGRQAKDSRTTIVQTERRTDSNQDAVLSGAWKKPTVSPPPPKPRVNYEATKDSRQLSKQGPSEVVFEKLGNAAVNDRTLVDLSKTKQKIAVTGRFVTMTRQGKSEKALGLGAQERHGRDRSLVGQTPGSAAQR
jgi:hypothetical protein